MDSRYRRESSRGSRVHGGERKRLSVAGRPDLTRGGTEAEHRASKREERMEREAGREEELAGVEKAEIAGL